MNNIEQTKTEIDQRIDYLIRVAEDAEGRFTRCREAANALARACYAAPLTDPDVTRAYDAYMALDSGNFSPPMPGYTAQTASGPVGVVLLNDDDDD